MSLIRLALASALVLGLTGCGAAGAIGNILGPIAGGTIQCDPGTQVQLASPTPGQTGVSGGIGQIVVVANGNANTLYNTSGQWYVTLTPQYGGNPIQGGNLVPFDGRNLNHPYTSDYYYSSSIGQLQSGTLWTAYLNEQNANCAAVPIGSFST